MAVIDVRPLELPEVLEIRPVRHADERGFFSEVWNEREWGNSGISVRFVQDNHSRSKSPGVLRGLHYQLPPAAQDKLVRVTRGSMFDVAVDIRRSSPSFGRWVGLILSASEWNQLLVPKGFAHGFLTLEPETEVQYKASAPYAPALERAIRFDDPAIAISWPTMTYPFILSPKDAQAPLLGDAEVFA